MNNINALDLLGLDLGNFPDRLIVIEHVTGMFMCYKEGDSHGVVCFSNEQFACDFMREFCGELNSHDLRFIEVRFDEAREIAKTRPVYINSIILLDDLNNPEIHYVR